MRRGKDGGRPGGQLKINLNRMKPGKQPVPVGLKEEFYKLMEGSEVRVGALAGLFKSILKEG